MNEKILQYFLKSKYIYLILQKQIKEVFKKNTLGQTVTNEKEEKQVIVSGNGSDLGNNEDLKDRAKRKTIT